MVPTLEIRDRAGECRHIRHKHIGNIRENSPRKHKKHRERYRYKKSCRREKTFLFHESEIARTDMSIAEKSEKQNDTKTDSVINARNEASTDHVNVKRNVTLLLE